MILVITLFIFFSIVGLGVLFLKLNYFVSSTNRLNSNKVLLSFDDGPEPSTTPQVLDILKKHEVGALFFTIGEKVQANKALTERINEEGHLIGNHSNTHNNILALYSTRSLINDLRQAENELDKIIKDRPKLFRPPIGYTNPNFSRALKRLELKCVGWRLRSFDTLFKSSYKLSKHLIKSVRSGDIVLLHDNLDVTLNALSDFIIQAKKNGIVFVSRQEVKNIFDD